MAFLSDLISASHLASSFMSASTDNDKLALPAFLKVLTTGGLSTSKAMGVASKIYKIHNTPSALGGLTDGTLTNLRVEDKEDRRLVLAAVKKAGFRSMSQSGKGVEDPMEKKRVAAERIANASSSSVCYSCDVYN